MAANSTTSLALEDPDLEVDYLIKHLDALETITTLGDPRATAQFTADELYGMFHALKVQAQRIAAAMEQPAPA